MNLLKLLILIILLKSTHESSTKCRDPNITCIELCCGMEQYYLDDFKWCRDLSEMAKDKWLTHFRYITKMKEAEFIEFGECSLSSNQSVIDICYSPKYSFDARDIQLIKYFNVPCDRFKQLPKEPYLRGWLLLELSPIFLAIILLFTWIKKDKKNNLSYKLISWYLTMMITTLLSVKLGIYIQGKIKSQDSPLIYWFVVLKFVWSSTLLWLSCIGYNAYVQFTEANIQNRERQDRIRFIRFSIFVWSGALTLCIVDEMLRHWLKFSSVVDVSMYFTACFNVIFFIILSLNIILIRCRVIGISTEKHIKFKLALTICRLCILMGIPRMISTILVPVIGFGNTVFIILHLEPYMVYGTFLAQYGNCVTLLRCKSCCPASQIGENERTTEDITMRNTSAI